MPAHLLKHLSFHKPLYFSYSPLFSSRTCIKVHLFHCHRECTCIVIIIIIINCDMIISYDLYFCVPLIVITLFCSVYMSFFFSFFFYTEL